MNNLRIGDNVFLVENNRNIKQGTVIDCFGGIYTVMMQGGGICKVKGHRLFATPEEANGSMHRRKQPTFRMSGTMYT